MKSWRDELQELVVEKLDMEQMTEDSTIINVIDEVLISQKTKKYLPLSIRFRYRKELFDSLRRLDILSEVSDDPDVTEIMVNGPNHIFVERNGKIEEFEGNFSSQKKLEDIIQQMAAYANRRVNEANPIVDTRLKDGSRVNIVLRIINKWLQLSGEAEVGTVAFDAKKKEKYKQIQTVMKSNYFNKTPIDLLLVLSYLEEDHPTQLDYSRYSYVYDSLILKKLTAICLMECGFYLAEKKNSYGSAFKLGSPIISVLRLFQMLNVYRVR